MEIISVNNILKEERLNEPTLNALTGDANNYSVLLFQPQGKINATPEAVRNSDEGLARFQFSKFLEEAREQQADLVVTPEYSMPWTVLREAISDPSKGPAPGKLWALGCEGIKYSEIKGLRDSLKHHAKVIFEEMTADDGKFVDPLAYVFQTTKKGNDEKTILVMLIQFKTCAMADSYEFEKNRLQIGNSVYQFGKYHADISLVSIICSDVFAFTDQIAQKV